MMKKCFLTQNGPRAIGPYSTAVIHGDTCYLSGVIPAVIFFPLVNGGSILLSALVGRLLFGEVCSKRQYLGFALGLAAILCIGLG